MCLAQLFSSRFLVRNGSCAARFHRRAAPALLHRTNKPARLMPGRASIDAYPVTLRALLLCSQRPRSLPSVSLENPNWRLQVCLREPRKGAAPAHPRKAKAFDCHAGIDLLATLTDDGLPLPKALASAGVGAGLRVAADDT